MKRDQKARAAIILARLLALKHEEDALRDELFELTYPRWRSRERDR